MSSVLFDRFGVCPDCGAVTTVAEERFGPHPRATNYLIGCHFGCGFSECGSGRAPDYAAPPPGEGRGR